MKEVFKIFDEIPDDMKAIYKTVWEIKQKALLIYQFNEDLSFVNHKALNIFMEEPDLKVIKGTYMDGVMGLNRELLSSHETSC